MTHVFSRLCCAWGGNVGRTVHSGRAFVSVFVQGWRLREIVSVLLVSCSRRCCLLACSLQPCWGHTWDTETTVTSGVSVETDEIKLQGARFTRFFIISDLNGGVRRARCRERKPGPPGSPCKWQGASSAGQREPTPHTHPPAIRPETNTSLCAWDVAQCNQVNDY